MKFKNHKQIVDILYKEWDLGKTASKAKGKACAWIYWFEILSEAEELVTEKINDTIVGVCAIQNGIPKSILLEKKFMDC